MNFIRQFLIEQKLVKILLLEIEVKEANDLKALRRAKFKILNSFWDQSSSLGSVKGKILAFKPKTKGSREISLEDKKQELLFILKEFKTGYESKLKN